MARISEYMKARRPDVYGDFDDDAIDEKFSSALSDPAQRGEALKGLRKVVPEWNDFSDDDLVGTYAKRQAPAPAPVPSSPPKFAPTQQEVRQLGDDTKLGQAAQSMRQVTQKNASLEAMGDHTDATREAASVSLRETIPVSSMDANNRPIRFNNSETWEEFLVQRDRVDPTGEKTKIVNTLGGQPQIVDKETGDVLGSLDKLSGYKSADVDQSLATTALDTLTGNASGVLQAPIGYARAALTGDPGKIGWNTGYGLTEAGADIGEKVGGGSTFGGMWGTATKAAQRAMQGVDMAQAGGWELAGLAGDTVGFDRLSKTANQMRDSNYEEVLQGEKNIDDINDFDAHLTDVKKRAAAGDVSAQQQVAEIDKLGGRYAGRMVGAAAPTVASLGANLLTGAAGRAAKAATAGAGTAQAANRMQTLARAASGADKVLNASELGAPAAAFKALRGSDAVRDMMPSIARGADGLAVGADKVVSGMGDLASQAPGAKFFGLSARGGLSRIADKETGLSDKDLYDHADWTKRSSADNEVALYKKQLDDGAAEIMRKHGVGEEQFDSTLTSVNQKWSAKEGRESMDAVEGELLDYLQPHTERLFELQKAAGKIPEDLQFNPFHPLYGQNSAARAMVGETWSAREAGELGNVNWVAKDHAADDVASLPGIRALSPETRAKMRAASMRSMHDLANQTRKRWEATGQMTPREIERGIEKMAQATTADGLTSALGDLLSSQKHGQKAALDFLEPHIQARLAKDPRWKTFDDALSEAGGNASDLTHQKNVRGLDTADDVFARGSDLDKYLEKEDLVVVRMAKTPDDLQLQRNRLHVFSNPRLAYLDNRVVPRNQWRAIEEIAGHEGPGKVYEIARWFDKWLGTSQAKAIVTQGNPGFWLRNDMSATMRVRGDEPDALAGHILEDVRRASRAPLSGSVEEIDAGSLGKMNLSDFNALARKELLGASRAAQDAELARRGGTMGSQALSAGLDMLGMKKAGKVAAKAEGARDWLINQSMRPAKAIGAQTRHLFDDVSLTGAGTKLADDLSYEEGLKIATFLSKLRRGVPKEKALKDVRELFIDYSDKAPIEVLLGGTGFIPFIRYHTGMLKGGLKIALQHPERFANLARYARLMEAHDQGMHGGAYDQRIKPMADQIAGNPMVDMDGQLTTVRMENLITEFGPLAAGAMGQDPRNLAQYLGPTWTRPYELATGKSPVTGRSVLGLPDDELKRSDGGLWGQAMQAQEDDEKDGSSWRLGGDSPVGRVAWEAGRGYLAEPYQALGRLGLDLGASPASASRDGTAGATQRAMLRMLTGLGTRRVDPVQEAAFKNRRGAERLPDVNVKEAIQAARKGRGRWGEY